MLNRPEPGFTRRCACTCHDPEHPAALTDEQKAMLLKLVEEVWDEEVRKSKPEGKPWVTDLMFFAAAEALAAGEAERQKLQAETERSVKESAQTAIDMIAKVQKEARQLQDRVRALEETLQALCDLQNGPPLPKYTQDWRIVMERAQVLLAEKP